MFGDWFYSVPPVTRFYIIASVATTAAVSTSIVTPLQLYLNFSLVAKGEVSAVELPSPKSRRSKATPQIGRKQSISFFFCSRIHQIWRLVTTFFYFGDFKIDFFFHMFFLARYSRGLEEGNFRGRSADYLWMLILGATVMLCIAPFLRLPFLSYCLTFMMIYVWARRNEHNRLLFLGVLDFDAPYLPYVFCAFSYFFGGSVIVDVIGIVVGHIYYFLCDVYPLMSGRTLIRTPSILVGA
mmetsp:Transcript_32914/g.84984  ORF Transcript_32914/g.84984 Transcript_32914/m.84984 type:complete len:239 (-) Transcript_32914:25-741(-)